MKCVICKGESFRLVQNGVRDNKNLNVMECENCGSMQLSCFDHILGTSYYEKGDMHRMQYHSVSDMVEDETWSLWLKETERDDLRRYQALKELCRRKRILDFGCGNGGFLRHLLSEAEADDIAGVELDHEARERCRKEGICVYPSLEETEGEFDVVTMFHVIEHLADPQTVLQKIREKLSGQGILIIETPNCRDALIHFYDNEEFKKFTFWSAHVILYNSESLERLVTSQGFKTVRNGQIQRYPLSNHLYWLAKGGPGGHVKWKEFNGGTLNQEYEESLKVCQACDTLFAVFRKT